MSAFLKKYSMLLFAGLVMCLFVYAFVAYYAGGALGIFLSLLVGLFYLGMMVTFYLRERALLVMLERAEEDLPLFIETHEIDAVPKGFFGARYLELLRELKAADDRVNEKLRGDLAFIEDYVTLWLHEIKTPIAAVSLILDNHPTPEATRIKRELAKMSDYADQALYYARAKNPNVDYLLRKMTLLETVNALLRERAETLLDAGARITREGLDVTVYSDPKWLHFILKQILDNAVQYADGAPAIDFVALEEGDHVLLSVRDHGIGIPAEDLPRVFERGYTGKRGREFSRATGMGLYLVRELATKLGLEIAVESTVGEGSAFTLKIPKKPMF